MGIEPFKGETESGVECHGLATVYELTSHHGWSLKVFDVSWENGERDVRAVDCRGPNLPLRLARLAHGLRLDVKKESSGNLSVTLRQARLKRNSQEEWPRLYKATPDELLDGAKRSVTSELRKLGAKVGSRRELLGDTSSHKNCLCAIFPESAKHIPVVAYTLTRVLPVWNRFGR